MATKGVERCNRCLLPKSSYLGFDDEGICSLCNTAKQINASPQDKVTSTDELDIRIESIKARGRGRPFDCVVGVSGGRDSSYLLYLLVHKHHLRCLAAYYRTPFTSEVIDANVKRLTAKLAVPLVEMDISRKLHKRFAREFVILWTKKPYPTIANMACAQCKLVNREIYKIAIANDTKSIVTGSNRFEAVQIASGVPHNAVLTANTAKKQLLPRAQFYNTMMLIKKGIATLGTSAKLWRYIPTGFKASVMYLSPHTSYLRFRYRGIFVLEYFYFAEWNEAEGKEVLSELEWQLPPDCISLWKSDCSFAELKNYMFRKMTGITYVDAFISNMVRDGVLSKDEALKRIEAEGKISLKRVSEICRILELPNSLLPLFKQETPEP